jgi:cell division protein FtsL
MKMWQKLKESFWEIEQVNLARQKFHELDQRTQNIVIGSSLGSVLAIALFLIGFFIYNCYSIRSEIQTAENTIQYLKQTSAKMDDLRRQIREQSSDPLTRDIDASLPLAQMVEKIAQKCYTASDV